jgi:hypothetical protein
MIFERFEKLTNDRMVKALIGMSRRKFDDLVPVFASAEDAIQQERLRKKEIKRLPSGGHQGVLNTPQKRLCRPQTLLLLNPSNTESLADANRPVFRRLRRLVES